MSAGDSVLKRMPWWRDVNEWMGCAAASTGTLAKHTPLILYGPDGSGKTHGVSLSARLHGLECIWHGSDDDPVYLKSQATRLRDAVLSKSLVPKILVIDDAEASLTCGGSSLDQKDLFRIAHGRLPTVVIAGPSLWAVPCLRKLPRGAACVVQSASLPINDVCALLQEEFRGRVDPGLVKGVVVARNGDVRGCRMDIASRFSESKQLSSAPAEGAAWSKCVRASDSVFDCVHAAFDMGGKTVARGQLEDILHEHGSDAKTLIATQYLAACPRNRFDVAETCADMLSQADAMGWSAAEASDMMQGAGLTGLVKRAREEGALSTERTLPVKQPLQGNAGKAMGDELKKMSAALLDVWKLKMATLGNASSKGDAWSHKNRKRQADARSFWRERDSLVALAERGDEPRRGALWSVDELRKAASSETKRVLAKRVRPPWEVPKAEADGKKRKKQQKKLKFE